MDMTNECICINLRRATQMVTQHYDVFLAPSGLKLTQFSLLQQIQLREPVSITELAMVTGLDRTTMGKNLQLIARRDLISLSPGEDRRERIAQMTRKGRQALNMAYPLWKYAQATMAAIPGLRESYGQLKGRMDKAVEDFRKEMAAVRTGRASVHMLDSVQVEYYGSMMPLNQIAQVHAPEAQLITVQPFDPSSLGPIEKSIRAADLGLNPMNDGKIIRVPVPPLTEERRRDMVKRLHKILEDHRTAVRNIRRDGNELIKKALKDKKITEDEERRSLDEIQRLTDDEIKKMEEMSKTKEKEVMSV